MPPDETPPATTTPRTIGRPPKWSPSQLEALRVALLERVSAGEAVGSVCKAVGVSRAEVWRWTQDDPTFRDEYARARELQAHALAEEALAIADATTPETAVADRLKLDARKWYTSKIAPRIFGERVHVEQDTTVRVVIERERPPDGVLARIAAAETASPVLQSGGNEPQPHATQADAACDGSRATTMATGAAQ